MGVLAGIKVLVSGGQTGVDRAAFDFALERGIEIGGFVPKGREAEDGPLPARYTNLTETGSADPAERTRLNVENSDATLVVSRGELAGGSRLTGEVADAAGKPLLHVDLATDTISGAAGKVRAWISGIDCQRLNIAGPRASEDPAIYALTVRLLRETFE